MIAELRGWAGCIQVPPHSGSATLNRRTSSGVGLFMGSGGAAGYFSRNMRKTFSASARSSRARFFAFCPSSSQRKFHDILCWFNRAALIAIKGGGIGSSPLL